MFKEVWKVMGGGVNKKWAKGPWSPLDKQTYFVTVLCMRPGICHLTRFQKRAYIQYLINMPRGTEWSRSRHLYNSCWMILMKVLWKLKAERFYKIFQSKCMLNNYLHSLTWKTVKNSNPCWMICPRPLYSGTKILHENCPKCSFGY